MIGRTECVDQAYVLWGRLIILVNNAGVHAKMRASHVTSILLDVWTVNLLGLADDARLWIPPLYTAAERQRS